MIVAIIAILLVVGMVFLMSKSDDFAHAVFIVIAVMVVIMMMGVALASCS